MALRIKELIKEKGMSVQELAEKMGISRVGLSQHINGNPSVEVLERIASALEVNPSDLFVQPKNNGLHITCPHCGKDIEIEVKQ
jgi:transcriptional regulator with XRE-family HTH domain